MESRQKTSTSYSKVVRYHDWCQPTRHSEPDRPSCCIDIQPPPDGPDLATYSQNELFGLGIVPSWDSSDILTNTESPFRLLPETSVTVRNLSPTVSAVNGQVSLYTSAFGIGMPRTLESAKVLSWQPSQQIALLFPLSQAILNAPDQRIGVYVRIDHPHDTHFINNQGSQILTEAFSSVEGRSFSVPVPVMNQSSAPQQITLNALPNELNALITPGTRTFAPLEQFTATVALQIPNVLHGTTAVPLRKDVTIVGRALDGSLIDGLTYIIWIDD